MERPSPDHPQGADLDGEIRNSLALSGIARPGTRRRPPRLGPPGCDRGHSRGASVRI